jgi:GNAT superfamily N-acetyltransferase
MTVNIRLASPSDAPTIASIHVRCWQYAYQDIVPDAVLNNLSVAAHEQLWRHSLEAPSPQRRTWIAHGESTILGFCSTGESADDDATTEIAEVGAIYLEPNRIGTGVGRALFAHAVQDLRHRAFLTATLWVFRDNLRARRFYEVAGWRPDAERIRPRGDAEVAEVRYRTDLSDLRAEPL